VSKLDDRDRQGVTGRKRGKQPAQRRDPPAELAMTTRPKGPIVSMGTNLGGRAATGCEAVVKLSS
jgi:hypothetical protein